MPPQVFFLDGSNSRGTEVKDPSSFLSGRVCQSLCLVFTLKGAGERRESKVQRGGAAARSVR